MPHWIRTCREQYLSKRERKNKIRWGALVEKWEENKNCSRFKYQRRQQVKKQFLQHNNEGTVVEPLQCQWMNSNRRFERIGEGLQRIL